MVVSALGRVRTYWFAPGVGWSVKANHSDNEGKDYTYELMAIAKP